MFRRLLYLSLLLCCSFFHVQAQDSAHVHCGVYPDYIELFAIDTVDGASDALMIPVPYTDTAKYTCGKFTLFYDDLHLGTGDGFADAAVGATRRNTLCQVLSYIQSTFDFSGLPDGAIRIHVGRSYTPSYPTPDPGSPGWCSPYFTSPPTGTSVNGYPYDYLKSGSDPMPGSYHMDLVMNFDSLGRGNTRTLGFPDGAKLPADFNNGMGAPSNCQYDLASIALHLFSHGMGFFSWRDPAHGSTRFTSIFTNIDDSARVGPDPHTSTLPMSPLTYVGHGTPTGNSFWVNNKQAPYNYPLAGANFSHLGEGYLQSRISPGNIQYYVMNIFFFPGDVRRSYTKGELETFHDIIGYGYNANPTTFAGSSPSAQYISNHIPYCSKMNSTAYNHGWEEYWYFADTVSADYTLTNNISSSLVINLASDTSLHDADGDTLSVMPGSLVNFRGCGEGGNNHNLLQLSNGNRTITYTPRPDYYGRSQFGYTLYDGKERGAFILVTIDVAKGTNVVIAKGDNLVLNGNFEEGIEVKLKDTAELVDNTAYDAQNPAYERLSRGRQYTDCHPYPDGAAIKGSYAECNETTQLEHGFGDVYRSFPWPWGSIIPGIGSILIGPEAVDTSNRYEFIQGPQLFNLGDSLRSCHYYTLEFDIMSNFATGFLVTLDSLGIGYTTSNYVRVPGSTHLLDKASMPFTAYTVGAWKHFTTSFSYCSDSAANVFFMNFYGFTFGTYSLLLDNLSIKEKDMTLSIADSLVYPCLHHLYANVGTVNTCSGLTYSWTIQGDTTPIATTTTIDVSPGVTTSYVLALSDCYTTLRDTVTITGSSCPCGPGEIFGDSLAFHSLTGTVSGSLGSGFYYVPADITITGSPTFTGAKILLSPGVTITIDDDAALTLDSCHLFVCPDTNALWKGIVLAGSGASSGRITAKNNTLIEDAEIAIKALSPHAPASPGDMIISCDDVIFNRNIEGIYIDDYTSSSVATYPFSFTNTVFTSRLFDKGSIERYPVAWTGAVSLKSYAENLAKAPFNLDRHYVKIACKNGTRPVTGIKLNNIGYFSSTGGGAGDYSEIVIGGGQDTLDANMFDNMGAGISGDNTNISSYNNTFINMPLPESPMRFPATAPYYRGSGVWVSSDKTVNNRLQVKQEMGVNSPLWNKFYDCYKGVSVTNYHDIDISQCYITGSHDSLGVVSSSGAVKDLDYGIDIFVRGHRYNSYLILRDTIINRYNGINMDLGGLDPWSITRVTDNLLMGFDPGLSTTITDRHYMQQAIRVATSSLLPITLLRSSEVEISANKINNVFNGIAVSNIQHLIPTVTNNHITLKEIPPGTKSQYGISINHCFRASVTNDSVTADAGSHVKDNDKIRAFYTTYSNKTNLCSNTESNIGRGFDFGQVTGQAIRWIDNSMDNNMRGFVLGSDIGDQAAVMGTSTLWHKFKSTQANLSNWSSSGWSLIRAQTYSENLRISANSKLYVRTSPATENPTSNASLPAGPPYSYDVTSIIPNNGSTAVCVIDSKSEHTGGSLFFKIIADSLGYGTDGKVNQWLAQLGIYKAGMIDPELSDSSYGFSQFMASSSGSRFEWLVAIEEALGDGDTTAAATLLGSPIPAMGRVQVDSNITVTDYTDADYVVDNYVDYYNLYLAYLKGTLDTSDLPGIAAIANLCPATYGGVVYQARAFYDMLTDQHTGYEDDSCMYVGQPRMVNGTVDVIQQYGLYPNPNDGNMGIRQYAKDEQPVQLMLYDMQGRLVYRTTLNFKQRSDVTLHIPAPASGLYLVQLRDSKGRNYTLKFQVK